MVSSGMLRRVALVRTDVSEELNASFIRVTIIGELGTTLAVTSNRRTQTLNSPETSVLTRTTRRNIPEDTILHSHHRENLKSYNPVIDFQHVGPRSNPDCGTVFLTSFILENAPSQYLNISHERRFSAVI
jgi:hypothetical protein